MSANKESLGKTVGIVVAVCLVCSVVVSGAAVGLRSVQQKNAMLDRQTNILEAAGLLKESGGDIATTYDEYIEERFVDLSSGQFTDAPSKNFDMYKAADNPDLSTEVQDGNVGFKRRATVAPVYLVRDQQGDVSRIILPVHGSGLWDLMYAFLAVDSDGNTTRELVYYEQGETPGLGAEVLNPDWKAKWDGKKLYKDGEVAIKVTKGASADNPYTVDALSGATLTSNGVHNQLQYWLSDSGFGPFLDKQPWKS